MMTRRITHLKPLKDSGYTKLILVKDIENGDYLVEKSLGASIDFQERLFENEMRVHSALQHRYIIGFLEITAPHRFLMEYAARGNLNEFIHKKPDRKQLLKTSINFLKGLDYLHKMGFAHNDIKPSNILITKELRAKLADFAFAGPIGNVTLKNPPAIFKLGTDLFRRPQMAQTGLTNLVENDIYAVGVVLYLLFSPNRLSKTINPGAVTPGPIRNLVRDCLNGTGRTVESIIKRLETVMNNDL